MNKDEFEIGPCLTIPEYRGQGIYPAVLRTIISNNEGVTFHMMVAENNHSSIKGIEKVGFIRQKECLVVSRLKRYKNIRNE